MSVVKFALDRLLDDPLLSRPLSGSRVALLAHPASVTAGLAHALDALASLPHVNLTAAFGPQHGLRGDKQDNMIETYDYIDPLHKIPVFSLYGKVRYPTQEMMDSFDVLVIDLLSIGSRIYTFVTTLRYMLEAAARHGKRVYILDRPNPAGRPVEGLIQKEGWDSFVGPGPMPMRYGLTMGELAHWFIKTVKLDVECTVISMDNWQPNEAPGYGWPLFDRAWINPSPNAPNLMMARCYSGTVMLEGTTLSEGRGTTRPLELLGAPDLNARTVIDEMVRLAPSWLDGCRLRECWFEPTFHKHAGKLCHGIAIHVDDEAYCHKKFRPWRLLSLSFKAIRRLYPDYPLWREGDFVYEYEYDRLAIDLINGSSLLREWVDDPVAKPGDLDDLACIDEKAWKEEIRDILLY